jgi:hypothetical protein
MTQPLSTYASHHENPVKTQDRSDQRSSHA